VSGFQDFSVYSFINLFFFRQVHASYHGAISQSVPCVIEGHLRTDRNWYGYLANITVVGVAQLTFEFVYPVERCCQNILFYRQDQALIVGARMNCWQKEYLLRPEDDQVDKCRGKNVRLCRKL
jgi:hypothetical protein